jgi:hypothetical protein
MGQSEKGRNNGVLRTEYAEKEVMSQFGPKRIDVRKK